MSSNSRGPALAAGMAKEPGGGGGGGSVDVGGGEPLPYLAPDDSQEFVQMADCEWIYQSCSCGCRWLWMHCACWRCSRRSVTPSTPCLPAAAVFIVLPQEGSQGLQERLPLHSQVLSRRCDAALRGGAVLVFPWCSCRPAHPLPA